MVLGPGDARRKVDTKLEALGVLEENLVAGVDQVGADVADAGEDGSVDI